MSIFDQIAIKIIKEQELVIGPLAWLEAGKVQGLKIIDQNKGEVALNNGDSKSIVDRLVNRYENIFGRASREVCKEAAASLVADLAPSEVPTSLQ
jgi:hypothetical protein